MHLSMIDDKQVIDDSLRLNDTVFWGLIVLDEKPDAKYSTILVN